MMPATLSLPITSTRFIRFNLNPAVDVLRGGDFGGNVGDDEYTRGAGGSPEG